MGDDVLRHPLAETRNAGKQGGRGGVEIDPDRVHAILHHRVEGAGELVLGKIVLVLPDADGFRVDLDEFGQWILQAARDRDGTA
jgi:hypothetical protein